MFTEKCNENTLFVFVLIHNSKKGENIKTLRHAAPSVKRVRMKHTILLIGPHDIIQKSRKNEV